MGDNVSAPFFPARAGVSIHGKPNAASPLHVVHAPARTNPATVEINPARKALLGKVPAMLT